MNLQLVLGAITSLFLLVYLVTVLARPERF